MITGAPLGEPDQKSIACKEPSGFPKGRPETALIKLHVVEMKPNFQLLNLRHLPEQAADEEILEQGVTPRHDHCLGAEQERVSLDQYLNRT